MGLGLSGLRLGLGQRGGGKSLGSIAASYGGAAILIDAESVFQDRSATPSTPASVGDPVGTIVGADGTYFAIAPSDGERAVLAEDDAGNLYLVGVSSARRYLVKDAGGTALAFVNNLHTGIYAAENRFSGTYAFGSYSFYTMGGSGTAYTAALRARNEADTALHTVASISIGTARHVGAYFYKDEPLFMYNGFPAVDNNAGKLVYKGGDGALALMSRRNNVADNGPSKFFGGVWVPGEMSTADEATCRALLTARMQPRASPVDSNTVVLDFENGEYEWGGVSRVLGDLTDNLDGSYTLDYTDWWAREFLVQFDINIPDETANTTDTTFLRLTDTADALPMAFQTPNDTGPLQWWFEKLTATASAYATMTPGNLAPTEGNMRVTAHFVPGQPVTFYYQGYGTSYTWDTITCPYFDPMEITVTPTISVGTVRRVTAKGGIFTAAEVRDFCNDGVAEPLHFVSDSFGSNQALELAVQEYTQDLGFIGMATTSTGGVGWDVLAPQYLAENANVRKSTLIMENGAEETTYTPAQGIAYIDSMVDALDGHDRWLYIESNPINTTNVAPGSAWQTMRAAYQSHMGSRFIPSLTAHQCAHLDNADDITDVTNGLWPRSQTGDLTHPNDIGKDIRGQVKYGALLRLGYVTGATATVPGVPQNVTEAGGLVKWDMPADNGNDPVREWNVYANDVLIYTGQLRQCALTLDDGEYTIGVTATNEVGEGAAAEISVSVGNLIANGTMDADTDWTEVISGTGVSSTISGGVMSLTGGNTPNRVYRYQAITTAIGQDYLLTYDQTGTFGYAKVGNSADSTALGSSLSSGTGLTISFTATATTTYITLAHQNNGSAAPVYDNVSVVAV